MVALQIGKAFVQKSTTNMEVRSLPKVKNITTTYWQPKKQSATASCIAYNHTQALLRDIAA